MIYFNNNIINDNFFYNKINKKKFLIIMGRVILRILIKKFNKKFKILFKNGIINIFIYIYSKKKHKYIKKMVDIKKIKDIVPLIHKKIKKYILGLKHKYYKKKIGKNLKLFLKDIINNKLILKDKHNNIYFYKIKYRTTFFKPNKYYYFLLKSLYLDKENLNITLILSRSDKLFLKNLFIKKIPEVSNRSVKIIDIARVSGRNKVVVYSKNKTIEPIGSCLGVNLLRLKDILKELDNEHIEIIKYSKNLETYIRNIFYNINIIRVIIKENIYIFYSKYDTGKFIGKYGYNIKLCKLLLNKYKLIIKCQ